DVLMDNNLDQLLAHYEIKPMVEVAQQTQGVAIVGISCKYADADDHQTFWQNLVDGKNSVREIPAQRWDWQAHYADTIAPNKTVSKWGALVNDVDCFDPEFFNMSAQEAKLLDPQERLLTQQVYAAIEDAGINIDRIAGSKTGVFVGYQFAEYEQYLRQNLDKIEPPLSFSSSSPTYYLANRLSYIFDFCGPSESVNINCASSAVAINRAFYSLLNSESDMAIAGGVCLNLFAGDYIANSQYGLLSSDGTSAVFDDNANGFTRGEGVAAIVLKRLDDAKADNDRIYGVIKACHQNNRGRANSLSEIKHQSITDVLSECYKKANLSPSAINYIEVDGYCTKWGDSFEFEGIKNVFAQQDTKGKYCALGSFKGNIGHPEPASGITAVIKLALSLHHKQFPATISKNKLSEFIDINNTSHPLYIADSAIDFADIRQDQNTPIRAGVNSFADSGANVHIVLEEYMPVHHKTESTDLQLLIFSAKDDERLSELVDRYIAFLSAECSLPAGGTIDLESLAYTLQTGRQPMAQRLAVIADSTPQLLEKLLLSKDRGTQKQGIYSGNTKQANDNALMGLITEDMANQQLQTQQWQQVALLWTNGVTIPWQNVWSGRVMQPLTLPGYPFAKQRYWVDIAGSTKVAVKEKAQAKQAVKTTAEPAPQWHIFMSDSAQDEVQKTAAEKIALFLKQIIAKQLKTSKEIDVDCDLLALGLNSMGVAELIHKTNGLLQVSLSPSVVFKYSQVNTLTEYIVTTYADKVATLVISSVANDEVLTPSNQPNNQPSTEQSSPFEILVPMQTQAQTRAHTQSNKHPIFAIPGAGGIALSMQQLCIALGDEQPFYCLEAVGLDGISEPMDSVQSIATANITELKKVQQKGPYRLLGYSNGGVVAFEMASQLLAAGDKVGSLTLLDTLCPLKRTNDSIDEVIKVFQHLVQTSGATSDLTVEQLQTIPEVERAEYLYQQVSDLGIDCPKAQFIGAYNVAAASDKSCRAYKPSKLKHKIQTTLLRATDSYQNVPKGYGWAPFLAKP
ncbi:MAG: hypothetical protein HRT35_34700, partial [Algicola sp.]|nr:hypothetical protein [Algicola sp.]